MKQSYRIKRTGENIKKHRGLAFDKGLVFLVLVLLTLGTIMVFSASYPYGASHYNDSLYYLKRQIIYVILGIGVMIFASKLKVKFYKKISIAFYIICIILLVIVLFGGFSEGVAKRWLGIPGTSLSFQPSELMKLGVVLMLSRYFENSNSKKKNIFFEIILPGIIVFLPCALILLEKHLSGTIIVVIIGISIVFMNGASIKKMLSIYGITGILGGVAFLFTNSYAMKRIESFFNSNADILSDKWQTTQGLYAIGSGGLWGLGLGNSRQKFNYVSEPQNDFIFTIWCEEMGYFGAVLVITLYALLIYKGYKIALNSDDKFSSLVAFGIINQVGLQAILNMCVVTDLVPNTGISLPFFSFGGSSLIILLFEMGILLSISNNSRQVS